MKKEDNLFKDICWNIVPKFKKDLKQTNVQNNRRLSLQLWCINAVEYYTDVKIERIGWFMDICPWHRLQKQNIR